MGKGASSVFPEPLVRVTVKQGVPMIFGALCLLSSCAWIAEPFGSSSLPPLERQGLLFAAIGIVSLLLLRGSALRLKDKAWVHLAIAGIALFSVPEIAISLASGAVPEISRSALFAMVPIVVVVVTSAGAGTDGSEINAGRFLAPALVGLGGLLLLLPLNFSGALRGQVMTGVIVAAVIVVGMASVRLYRVLQSFTLGEAMAVICLSNAAVLLIYDAARVGLVWSGGGFASLLLPPSLVDLAEILMLVALLRAMPPVRFASRYLLIPLLTVVQGYILMRPVLTVRVVAGAALLAAGTGLLLFLQPAEDQVNLSLR